MKAFPTRWVKWVMILTVGLLPASFVTCDPVNGFYFERYDDDDFVEYYYDEPCWDCWW
jgi:hypothetical protein